jgi:hypothetical protein
MQTTQTTAHLKVDDQVIKVLVRPCFKKDGGYVALKLRKGGQDGVFLEGESHYLAQNPDTFADLLNGEVVKL